MKKLICATLAILLLTSFLLIACQPTETPPDPPKDQDQIKAVITAEPSNYTLPILDRISTTATVPTLTDEEMYNVVFVNQSNRYEANDDVPVIDFAKGEATLTMTVSNAETGKLEVTHTYLCKGVISTTLHGNCDKYAISPETQRPLSFFTTVQSSYWQQYFDVMLANIEFTNEFNENTDNLKLATLRQNDTNYTIYENGTIVKDGEQKRVGNKKVDAPLIYYVGLMYNTNVSKSNSLYYRMDNQIEYSIYLPEEIEMHYNGKVAKFSRDELLKLFSEQANKPINNELTYKRTYNEHFLDSKDYAYFTTEFDEDDKQNGYSRSWVIDSDGTLYFNRTNPLSDRIEGGTVCDVIYQYQCTDIYENAFDFTKIKALFQ